MALKDYINIDGSKKYKFTKKSLIRGGIAGGVLFVVLRSVWALIRSIPLVGVLLSWLSPLVIFGTVVVSAAAALFVAVMNLDLDVTTPRAQKKLQRELDHINTKTGDDTANQILTSGQSMVREIRECNAVIADEDITRQLYDIENMCVQIFKTVADEPSEAPQIRKFMNYYLPTTVKMLKNYRTMQERGVSPAEMRDAHDALTRGLSMIQTTCHKQLDSLYKDNIMDVSTDIDVLEQMLKRDGFSDGSTVNAPQIETGRRDHAPARPSNARTAAAAQVGSASHPTLMTNLNEVDILPHSSSHRAVDDDQ